MKLTPLEDRILVEQFEEEEEEQRYGNIIIPDTGKERPTLGEVLAVGPGKYEHGVFIEMPVEVGDVVVFGKYAGSTVEIEGREVLFMRTSDVMAIADAAR